MLEEKIQQELNCNCGECLTCKARKCDCGDCSSLCPHKSIEDLPLDTDEYACPRCLSVHTVPIEPLILLKRIYELQLRISVLEKK